MTLLPVISAPSVGRYTHTDFPDVAPFTIREGATWESVLSSIRVWIRDELVPFLQETNPGALWDENADALTAAVNTALKAATDQFTAMFNDHFVGSIAAPAPTGNAAIDTPNVIAAIATARAAGFDLRLTPSPLGAIKLYRMNQPITWSMSRGSLLGVGHVTLDFSQVATSYVGAALTLEGEHGDFSQGAHLGAVHRVGGFRMTGHGTDTSTMDALLLHDAVPDPSTGGTMGNIDQGTVEFLQVAGFRDGITFKDHVWAIEFHKCAIAASHRYGINLQMGTDAGEQIRLVGTSIYGTHNAAKSAAAVYAPANTNVEFAMVNGSLDYNDTEGAIYGGNLSFENVHIEDNGLGAMFIYKQTGPGGISVSFKNCSWDSSSSAFRAYVHQVLAGSGSNVLIDFDGDKGGVHPETRSIWCSDDSGNTDQSVTVSYRNHTVTGYHTLGQPGGLVINPGMDPAQPFVDSGHQSDGWWPASAIAGSTWTLGPGGSPGAGIRLVSTQVANHYAQQNVRIPAGRPLWIEGRIFVNALTSGAAEILVTWLKADGTTLADGGRVGSTVAAQSTDWSIRTRRFMPPPGAVFAQVRLSGGNFVGTVTWDNVNVIPM